MSTQPTRRGTVIIGSGVAAVGVARQLLAADPTADILILEAGPKVPMRDFRLWTDFLVTGDKPYAFCEDQAYPTRDTRGANLNIGQTVVPLQGSRLMIYGGSTVHWGGWSFRLKPEDFQLATNTGQGIDWPFDYQTLSPWYDKAEHYIQVSGETDDPPRDEPYPFPPFPFTLEDGLLIDAFESLDISYQHLPIARHGVTRTDGPMAPCQTTGTCKYCPFGARFVAGNVLDYLLSTGTHPHLEARYHVVVEELLMDGRNRVRGVRCRDRGHGEAFEVEADRVVVAAGAIESPKLLLRSRTAEWPQGVGNDHDLVGRNLITHPYFMIEATLPKNPLLLQEEMDFPTLCSRHFDSPEEQKAGKYIFINPSSNVSVDIAGMMQEGLSRDRIDAVLAGPQTIQLHGMVEIFSEPQNRVRNLERTNQFGLHETVVDYSQAADFNSRMDQIVAEATTILEAAGATDVRLSTVSWRADHAACTCRMAETPDIGVVDPDLKVFDVDNLWICSNATFASLGAVNPTLTLAALSLRLGDHLAGLDAGCAEEA